MPYQWSPAPTRADPGTGAPETRLRLWPHRSLPRRGFVVFIAATAGLMTIPLVSVLGSPMLWALLPFVLAALAGLWWALTRSYRGASEILTLSAESLHLTHNAPGQPPLHWQTHPYWVTLHLRPAGSPVPNYLTMQAGAREVELGAFLTPQERATLHAELQAALNRARAIRP